MNRKIRIVFVLLCMLALIGCARESSDQTESISRNAAVENPAQTEDSQKSSTNDDAKTKQQTVTEESAANPVNANAAENSASAPTESQEEVLVENSENEYTDENTTGGVAQDEHV